MEVTYIHHCGDDLTVVNAARVSFKKEHTTFRDNDEGLIRFLAEHKHFSPFNHCFVTFHIKAPVFVARQLVKHEYMPWNEVSRRYVDEDPEFYWPGYWRERSPDKKQGSAESVLTGWKNKVVQWYLHSAAEKAVTAYKIALNCGVAPEQARIILPHNMYTEWYWSGTLKAFAKMCSLRLKPDAQFETFNIADQIDTEMQRLYPVSWCSLMNSGKL